MRLAQGKYLSDVERGFNIKPQISGASENAAKLAVFF